MFALSGEENPILPLEDAKYDKGSDSVLDDTDVDEPPPCPVDMMYQNWHDNITPFCPRSENVNFSQTWILAIVNFHKQEL